MATPGSRPERIGTGAALAQLPLWRAVEGRDAIARSLRFRDFAEAFAFMTRIAATAKAMDHHPEWTHVYNRVEIILSTHDAGGFSEKDVHLARAIDELAPERAEHDPREGPLEAVGRRQARHRLSGRPHEGKRGLRGRRRVICSRASVPQG